MNLLNINEIAAADKNQPRNDGKRVAVIARRSADDEATPMLLSDRDIKTKLESGEIGIVPMPDLDKALGTVSLDLRLGGEFMVYRSTSRPFIDVNDPESFNGLTELVVKDVKDPFVIHPREFVLGSTMEIVTLPADLAARLEGKSSLGRLGIVIHSTAGKVDPGFNGRITLEISNIGTMPIMIYPGMRICQLLFEQLTSPPTKIYTERESSKYKEQLQPLGSKITAETNDPRKPTLSSQTPIA